MKSSFESNNVGYTTEEAVYHLVVLTIDQYVLRFTDSRHCDIKLSMTERFVTHIDNRFLKSLRLAFVQGQAIC